MSTGCSFKSSLKICCQPSKICLNPPGDAHHQFCIRKLKNQTSTQTHQCAGESCADPSATELDLGLPTGCHVGSALWLQKQQNKRTKSNSATEKQGIRTGQGSSLRRFISVISQMRYLHWVSQTCIASGCGVTGERSKA